MDGALVASIDSDGVVVGAILGESDELSGTPVGEFEFDGGFDGKSDIDGGLVGWFDMDGFIDLDGVVVGALLGKSDALIIVLFLKALDGTAYLIVGSGLRESTNVGYHDGQADEDGSMEMVGR